MREQLTQALRRLARRFGVDLVAFDRFPVEFSDADKQVARVVEPFTMTQRERVCALIQATKYVRRAEIPGAIVECGVWKGGSMMAVALTLLEAGAADRDLYLFDTFGGMTRPTAADISSDGAPAAPEFERRRLADDRSDWCHAGRAEVEETLRGTGYPSDLMHFVEGRVEDTIPGRAPERVALLRLDTDWYESTRHELEHLYPRLSRGGVIIIDDYGEWQGARRATDEYLCTNGVSLLLNRIDQTGRIGVKV